MSKHPKKARDTIIEYASHFTAAQQDIFGVAAMTGREAFNQDTRKMTGKPESHHADRTVMRIGAPSNDFLSPDYHNHEAFQQALTLVSVPAWQHDIPESTIRRVGAELLAEYVQSLPASFSKAKRIALKREYNSYLKREVFPQIREEHIDDAVVPLTQAIIASTHKNNVSVEEVFGVRNALEIIARALDYLTPFPPSTSNLVNSYADRMRTALHGKHATSKNDRTLTYLARMVFLIAKTGDRIDNTGTMYAANNPVRQALAVTTMEEHLAHLNTIHNPAQWTAHQAQLAKATFAVVDHAAKSEKLKTGDSFDQNKNDMKNIVCATAALNYAQRIERIGQHDETLLTILTNALEELLKETAFHAKQHAYSLVVYGIREVTPHGVHRYHHIAPNDPTFEERIALVEDFKRTNGWNRLDTTSNHPKYRHLSGILQTDHLAEQRGRSDAKEYLYDAERYLWHSLYYWKKAEDLSLQVHEYNDALREHLFSGQPAPSLKTITPISGSLSTLADGEL